MSALRFHHLGVGTARIDEAVATYLSLGYTLRLQVDDPLLDVRLAFLTAPGSPLVEIVGPLGPDGPLKTLLARKLLPSPYHTAYAVDDLDAASVSLRDRGFMPLGEPRPARAFGGARILYHYHLAVGLLELVEGEGTLAFTPGG